MFGRFGGSEMLIVLLIVLLLFGASRLPRLARSLREARDEFQKGEGEEPAKPPSSAGTPPVEGPPTSASTMERAPDQPPPDAT